MNARCGSIVVGTKCNIKGSTLYKAERKKGFSVLAVSVMLMGVTFLP